MYKFSYHTHSHFCDGKSAPEVYVEKAISNNMKAIGFASHAPINDTVSWAMKRNETDSYAAEILRLKQKYQQQTAVYLSMEIDYIPGVTQSFDFWKEKYNLDYTVGSVHLVKADSDTDFWFLDGAETNYGNGVQRLFRGDIRKAVTAYYHQVMEMIITQKPDIAGHIDKVKMNNRGRYFSETDKWYIDLVEETLAVAAQSGTVVEVNTRGLYKKKSPKLFPDDYFLQRCCELNIPLTISSDAHHPDELLLNFDTALQRIKQLGGKHIFIFDNGKWKAIDLFSV